MTTFILETYESRWGFPGKSYVSEKGVSVPAKSIVTHCGYMCIRDYILNISTSIQDTY